MFIIAPLGPLDPIKKKQTYDKSNFHKPLEQESKFLDMVYVEGTIIFIFQHQGVVNSIPNFSNTES